MPRVSQPRKWTANNAKTTSTSVGNEASALSRWKRTRIALLLSPCYTRAISCLIAPTREDSSRPVTPQGIVKLTCPLAQLPPHTAYSPHDHTTTEQFI